MAHAPTRVTNRPAWVDLATKDAGAARDFYGKLFGWKTEVNPDPKYGGYGRAKIGGEDAAGIGPVQSPEQPTTWSFYIGTDDAAALGRQVEAAGGKVITPAFDVGEFGKMAVFQDPAGAYISAWQPTSMGGFRTQGSNGFGWAELNARGIDRDVPFYQKVFGWQTKKTPDSSGGEYIEFQVDGQSVAGGAEMSPQAPQNLPSHWLVYFNVDDVAASHRKALDLGARTMTPPQTYEGGEFAILTDPQGATFGLFKSDRR